LKKVHAAVVITVVFGLSAVPAAASDQPDHGRKHGSTSAAAEVVDGVVKKVDKSSGKVTIAHGPIASHNMPAMTMVFLVKDPAWLDRMADGDRIRFTGDKVNGAFTVTQFEQVK